jgi:predicted Fe-Mo cluster-binding NifX family protein
MNLCIPVNEDLGLRSPVCSHFGSAPAYLIVDTETRQCRSVRNTQAHHSHGACAPLASLRNEQIDGLAVEGIGPGAIDRLRAAGIEVFAMKEGSVEATVEAARSGSLTPIAPGGTCGGHHSRHADQHRQGQL